MYLAPACAFHSSLRISSSIFNAPGFAPTPNSSAVCDRDRVPPDIETPIQIIDVVGIGIDALAAIGPTRLPSPMSYHVNPYCFWLPRVDPLEALELGGTG
jgi:hypothetical protein